MKKYGILILPAAFFLVACGQTPTAESPTGVWRRYVEASQKQEIATMRSLLSRGSLMMLEEAAQKERLSITDVLRREAALEIKKSPETRNEKIEGETASVEIANDTTGQFETMPFVREDGAWKIARDKYAGQVRKAATDAGQPENRAP